MASWSEVIAVALRLGTINFAFILASFVLAFDKTISTFVAIGLISFAAMSCGQSGYNSSF